MSKVNPFESPAPLPEPDPFAPKELVEAKFQSLEFVTRLLQGTFLALIAVAVCTAFSSGHGWQLLQDIIRMEREIPTVPGFEAEQRKLNEMTRNFQVTMLVIGLVGGALAQLLVVVYAIALLVWIHKAYSNLPALAYSESRYPIWFAMLLLFIPIVNIFALGQIVHEIAKASDPQRLGPEGHQRGGVHLLVIFWWVALVGSIALNVGLLFSILEGIDTRPQALANLKLQMVASAYSVLPMTLAWWMFGSIWANQHARREVVLRLPSEQPVAAFPNFLLGRVRE